jgi:mRNA-degrading endonuclease RelE of RelBE toxin-antitoxin system
MDRRAERQFRRLPPDIRRRFLDTFDRLAEDPFRPRPGCDIRNLKGEPGARVVRVGAWRALYVVREGHVFLTWIEPRKRAYR